MSSCIRRSPAMLALIVVACAAPPPTNDVARPICVKTLKGDVEVPTEQAADVLIVVDNSGSMAEEQANLASNFLNQDPDQCPLQDLRNIPAEFKNPRPELYTGDGPLAQCGFIQIVAAFENDFRVGVITTDVGLCDNRVPPQGDTRGFQPQRGCLQPDALPTGRKVIAAADLIDDDDTNDDLAARFADTLEGISTLGSPFERGLDAMNIFLDPESDRNPDCADDLTLFRRPDASLVVIFLTDEEDCSHGLGGQLEEFGDENTNEICGEFPGHFLTVPSSDCYARQDALSDVSLYVDGLLAQDPRAKVAVIAGAVNDGDDVVPAGCIVGDDGEPEGGDDVCFSSGGLSNATLPGQPCADDTADDRGGVPCCLADGGARYFDFAELVGNKATDSICNSSFRETMLDIAAFIAAVDVVELAETASPGGVLVEVTRADDGEVILLEELNAADDCETVSGFRLDGERVLLCGDGRPGPGDSIRILARGEEEETCGAPKLETSGGGVNCAAAGALPAGAVLAAASALLAGARRRRQSKGAR